MQTVFQGGVEDALPGPHHELMFLAVQQQAHAPGRTHLAAAAGLPGCEALLMNRFAAHAQSLQRRGDLVHHGRRAAGIELAASQLQIGQCAKQLDHSLSAQTTAVATGLLGLGKHVQYLQAPGEAALQRLELVAENHCAGMPIAIDQGHSRVRFEMQGRAQDGKDRADTAARRKQHDMPALPRSRCKSEAPLGAQGPDAVTGSQLAHQAIGYLATGHALDGDRQGPIQARRAADGIGPAPLASLDIELQGQVLPGLIANAPQ
ncbi:hypothetical protein SRABI70_04544 [Pseudomonas sp. Bi70]|nr:hypothetical protein SRABI70_04544 [Pseudomonas sp. Bi70]